MATMIRAGWAHGVHHQHHYEYCWSLAERLAAIETKPANEVATRKRLLGLVPLDTLHPDAVKALAVSERERAVSEQALAAYQQAWAVYEKALAVSEKVRAAYQQARAVYQQARAAYQQARAVFVKVWAAHPLSQAEHDKLWPGCTWNGTEFVYPKGV